MGCAAHMTAAPCIQFGLCKAQQMVPAGDGSCGTHTAHAEPAAPAAPVQCDGSEVANCKTPNAANKCLCDVCQPDYQPSANKTSCSLCPDISNCGTGGMNADSCLGCDTCAPGYSRATDGMACSQASWAVRLRGWGCDASAVGLPVGLGNEGLPERCPAGALACRSSHVLRTWFHCAVLRGQLRDLHQQHVHLHRL